MKAFFNYLFFSFLVFGLCGTGYATSFDFDTIYDGTSSSLASGSDNPIGTNLLVGDNFSYKINTVANDFWQVDVGGSFFPFLAFGTSDSATRIADFDLTFMLDGVLQYVHSEVGASNSFIHIGTNVVTLATGLQFDELLLNYTLNSSSNVNSNIISYFWADRSPESFDGISYNHNVGAPVPEPTTMLLFGTGILGLLYNRKRNSKNN